jgi:hypothetical protein
VTGRSFDSLPWICPLIGTSDDLDSEAPGAERGDDQAAARVGGIRLGMAGRAERHQPVEIEVRAPLGALDDVVDLEGAPAATGLAPPAGAKESTGIRVAPGRRRAHSLQLSCQEAEHCDRGAGEGGVSV